MGKGCADQDERRWGTVVRTERERAPGNTRYASSRPDEQPRTRFDPMSPRGVLGQAGVHVHAADR